MSIAERKSWHVETAELTKLKPNLIPKDLFFQFKKHQPFRFNKRVKQIQQNSDIIPASFTRIEKSFKNRLPSAIPLRPSSQCSVSRCSSEFRNYTKESLNISSHIKDHNKASAKILNEIDMLLNKENICYIKTNADTIREKDDAIKEYQNVSHKISLISRGKLALKKYEN